MGYTIIAIQLTQQNNSTIQWKPNKKYENNQKRVCCLAKTLIR